jgi:hypothetical protein
MMSGQSERVAEIKMGALYKLGTLRPVEASTMISLMVGRVGLSEEKAKQLFGHWSTTKNWKRATA